MREIKFRAWDKKANKMRVVWDIGWKGWDHPDESLNYVKIEGDGTYDLLETEVEIMQFTDMKDKEGREIYEGDILEIVEEHEEGCTCDHCFPYRKGEKVKVVWFNSEFGLLPADYEIKEHYCELCAGYIGLYSPNHEMPIGFFAKVIGNIYDKKYNPRQEEPKP